MKCILVVYLSCSLQLKERRNACRVGVLAPGLDIFFSYLYLNFPSTCLYLYLFVPVLALYLFVPVLVCTCLCLYLICTCQYLYLPCTCRVLVGVVFRDPCEEVVIFRLLAAAGSHGYTMKDESLPSTLSENRKLENQKTRKLEHYEG